MNFKTTLLAGVVCTGLFSQAAEATIVKLETNVGDLYVNLYDETTPTTVNNFLNYVNSGRYDNTFIHRSVSNFVVQGGGFQYSAGNSVEGIETDASINNEAKLSNVRGTISMAKISGQPNSATSQWFINLVNNNASGTTNLDSIESGYSVFGELTSDSMVLIDQVAGYSKYDVRSEYSNGALGEVPLKDYSQAELEDGIMPDENNFIIIHTATVSDAATDTASDLNPPANPNYNSNTGSSGGSTSSGGGGNMGLFTLFGLAMVGMLRRRFC